MTAPHRDRVDLQKSNPAAHRRLGFKPFSDSAVTPVTRQDGSGTSPHTNRETPAKTKKTHTRLAYLYYTIKEYQNNILFHGGGINN